MKQTVDRNILIGLGVFAFISVTAYWFVWFTNPAWIQSRTPSDADYPIYTAFEQAFVLADAWLAATALVGAVGLSKRRPWGLLFMLLAGSASIFLGLMDLLYDLQHQIFIPLSPGSTIELIIVCLLLAFGPVTIILSWRNRRELLI